MRIHNMKIDVILVGRYLIFGEDKSFRHSRNVLEILLQVHHSYIHAPTTWIEFRASYAFRFALAAALPNLPQIRQRKCAAKMK